MGSIQIMHTVDLAPHFITYILHLFMKTGHLPRRFFPLKVCSNRRRRAAGGVEGAQ